MSPARVPKVVLAVRRFLDGPLGPPAGSRGVVAVSGGPDSTALLLALHALAPRRGLRLVVGHVDHGLRAASRAEAAHVAALAASLDLPVRIERAAVDPTRNLEAAARRARRAALGRIADQAGAAWIALGHTRDDQVETTLLRLLRGAGRRGLGAMRPRSGPILRPLLDATRSDVRWYLADRTVVPIEDPSNADLRFARNRIRHLIVPLLARELGGDFGARVAALAARLRDEDDLLETLAAARARALGVGEALPVSVGREPLALARRIVRGWLESVAGRAVSSRHVAAALAVVARPGGRAIALPGGTWIGRMGDALTRLEGPPGSAPRPVYELPVEFDRVMRGPDGTRWRLRFSSPAPATPRLPVPRDAATAWFDADRLPGPLIVRNPRPGDRIRIPGVGRRKLHDVLMDRRVPRAERGALAVVAGGDEVLWVPGIARGAPALPSDATRSVIRAVLLPENG